MLIHSADIALYQKHLRIELAAILHTAGVSKPASNSDTASI